jgi:hypothetical protein
MQTLIAIILMLILPPLFLAAACAYGPLENRFLVWRRMRREAAWPDAALDYLHGLARPIRIAQLTPYGWAEVVPGEGFAPAGRHRADVTRMVALTVKAA